MFSLCMILPDCLVCFPLLQQFQVGEKTEKLQDLDQVKTSVESDLKDTCATLQYVFIHFTHISKYFELDRSALKS